MSRLRRLLVWLGLVEQRPVGSYIGAAAGGGAQGSILRGLEVCWSAPQGLEHLPDELCPQKAPFRPSMLRDLQIPEPVRSSMQRAVHQRLHFGTYPMQSEIDRWEGEGGAAYPDPSEAGGR